MIAFDHATTPNPTPVAGSVLWIELEEHAHPVTASLLTQLTDDPMRLELDEHTHQGHLVSSTCRHRVLALSASDDASVRPYLRGPVTLEMLARLRDTF